MCIGTPRFLDFFLNLNIQNASIFNCEQYFWETGRLQFNKPDLVGHRPTFCKYVHMFCENNFKLICPNLKWKSQFYENDLFIRYNMFNNHFFSDKQDYTKFLNKSKKLLIIMDPPFGGIVKLIAHSIDQIKGDCPHKNVSVILFYPYFIESWIKKWQPELKMIDYKVTCSKQAGLK